MDWKEFWTQRLSQLDPEVKERAVLMLLHKMRQVLPEVRAAMDADPQRWWITRHFRWGLAVRNLLRREGFGESVLGVDLDEVYVGLVELAARRSEFA